MRVPAELPIDIIKALPAVLDDLEKLGIPPQDIIAYIIREWMEGNGYLELPPPGEETH